MTKAKLENLETRVIRLEHTVESRAENHRRNNEAFAEITRDYTKLQDEKDALQNKVYVLEKEQAVQQSTVSRMLGEIIEIKKEVKDFMEKVVMQLANINTTIATERTKDSTIISVVKFLMQLIALGITISGAIVAVLKYAGIV